MIFNRLKLERGVTFTKCIASLVPLIYLPKTLTWNNMIWPGLNLLQILELVKNVVENTLFQKHLTIFFFPSNLLGFKACVPYFLWNFYFFIKWWKNLWDLQKLWKMFFISSKNLFSFSRYSNFCNFFPSFPHYPDLKGQMKVE